MKIDSFFDTLRSGELGLFGWETDRTSDRLIAYAWPGGYPVVYYDRNCAELCPDCATRLRREYALACQSAFWAWVDSGEEYREHASTFSGPDCSDLPVSGDIHWEGSPIQCADCGEDIESAYGEEEEDTDND